MSVIFQNKHCVFISHKHYIDEIYKDLILKDRKPNLNKNLFEIFVPYKNKKVNHLKTNEEDTFIKEINSIRNNYINFQEIIGKNVENKVKKIDNAEAMLVAEHVYNESSKYLIENAVGCNNGPAVITEINNTSFLFPRNSRFFCKDVKNIGQYLNNEKFDLILLDPPWWNKYIRRKRKKSSNAYNMLCNEDLKNIPLENMLEPNGLIAVWCTNSQQHLNHLKNEIFPKWKVKLIGQWYWLKVTKSGDPICGFSQPPGKQPFERIVFGTTNDVRTLPVPESGKLVISVPSAVHSHKPPLVELLQPYLPENAKCLEIFARYLLPDWTSFGLEALKLQHKCLYECE